MSGDEYSIYGGHTSCYELDAADPVRVLIDAGTGLLVRQRSKPEPAGAGLEFHLFLTHYHWDHLLGLPFFRPLYDPSNRFIFYGHQYEGRTVRELITAGFSPPLFPIALDQVPAAKDYVTVLPGDSIEVAGITVGTRMLHHPQGVTAYRFDRNGTSLVLATDVERIDAADRSLDELAAGTDLLLHDAQFTPDEYRHHQEWGHSSWSGAAEAARRAGAAALMLVSHDPSHTDADIDALLAEARRAFPATDAAREGQTIAL